MVLAQAGGPGQQHRPGDRVEGSSGRTIVRFQLRAPPANPPAGFAIASPARIALDFLDTINGLGATQRQVDDAALRSFNVIQAGNRTRVVFNLNRPQTFETAVEGNAVLVTLFDQERQARRDGAERCSASPRRGPATCSTCCATWTSAAAATARAASSSTCPTRRPASTSGSRAAQLIVDFISTSVPRNLERRLDVADFGDAGGDVDTFAQGANARMVIEPKGLWEHSAYQADNRFILEVKPIQEDPNKLMQGSRGGYKGEKLSLNFQNVEVRAVLQVIADFTGLNIITSDTVQGSLTLRLKDIPWDQALDIILQTKGLDMRKNGNVVLIAPREELALKEKQQLENAIQIGELEPLVVRVVPAELHQGAGHPQPHHEQPAAAVRRGAGQTATTGGQGSIISQARRRDPRSAVEHPVRHRHARRGSRRCARSSARSTRRSGRC